MQQKSEINFKKGRKIDRQTLNQIKRQVDKHYSRKRDRQTLQQIDRQILLFVEINSTFNWFADDGLKRN